MNPWLEIPLEDYEGHMGSPGVRQLSVLSDLFRKALDRCRPASVALLGVAGGNGLEHIDSAITKRVVGVDINRQYLEETGRRFATLAGLELRRCDIAGGELDLASVALVHAALIFEHTGLGPTLANALSLVAPGGTFSVVLQLPSDAQPGVAPSGYASIQRLSGKFALIDVREFQCTMEERGFALVEHETRALSGGKGFWLGIFAIPARPHPGYHEGDVDVAPAWTPRPHRRAQLCALPADPRHST